MQECIKGALELIWSIFVVTLFYFCLLLPTKGSHLPGEREL